MHIFRAAFAALYVSALAFVAGQITAHVVARRPGNFATSNESLVVALLELLGLVIVGLTLGVRRARAGARAANMLPPGRSEPRRANAVTNAIDLAERSAVVPAERAAGDSAELEVFESACDSRASDALERAMAWDVGEVNGTVAEPTVGGPLEPHAASTVDTGVEQPAQHNAGDIRERSADPCVADVADCRAEDTAPVSTPPAIHSATTEHIEGPVDPGVVDSRARAVAGPGETPHLDATGQATGRRARMPRVLPPSTPGPVPFLPPPRIITATSREGVARAWVAGGAFVVSGFVAFAFGERVQFGRPIAVLLAVLGLALVARAATVTVARRRVGKTWVQLRNSPIAPGGEIEGLIWSSNRRLRRAVRGRKPMRPARVRVLCLRGPAPARRATSSTNSALVWQKEVAVTADRMTVSTGHLGIPFRFDVPADVPEMSRSGDANPIVWLLSVEMATAAVALAEQFELPIYQREPVMPRSAA